MPNNFSVDIFNKAEQIVAVASNYLPNACPLISARRHEQAVEKGCLIDTFSFAVDATHPDAGKVVEDGFVGFFDLDNNYQLYRIVKTERVDGAQSTITAECEHAFYELLDFQLIDVRPTNVSASTAAGQALAGTRWELGNVNASGISSARLYFCSVLAGLATIAEVWSAELKYRIAIANGVITHRYVDIVTRRGSIITGKTFTFGRDLIGVKETIDKSNLATALIGLGKSVDILNDDPYHNVFYGSRVNFKYEGWVVAGGSPANKAPGELWVGDDAAKQLYGVGGGAYHRMRIVYFDDIEDPALLLQATWDELQRHNYPEATYELDVVTLEGASGYSHEAVRLGDTVYVSARQFTGTARVYDIDRNLLDLTDAAVKLGNVLPGINDTMVFLQRKQREIDDKLGAWDRAGSMVNKNADGSFSISATTPIQIDAPLADEVAFTPTLVGSTGGEATYTSRAGVLRRSGNTYVATIDLYIATKGTMTGNVMIGGLPAVPKTNPSMNWVTCTGVTNAAGYQMSLALAAGSTAVTLRKDAGTYVAPADVANGAVLRCTMTFLAQG